MHPGIDSSGERVSEPVGCGKNFFTFFHFFRFFPLKFATNFKKINFSDLGKPGPTPARRRPHRKNEISRVSKGRKKPSANRIREIEFVRRARQRAGRSRKKFLLFFHFFHFFPLKFAEKFEKIHFWRNPLRRRPDAGPTPTRRRPHRKNESSRVRKRRKKPSANRICEMTRRAGSSSP